MREQISYLVISDIHLGNTGSGTEVLVDNLRDYFRTNLKLFKSVDMIILAGDVYDRLLANNSKEYELSLRWLLWLVAFVKKWDIRLRILEGTPSHDRKQVATLATIIDEQAIDVDFKYIDRLSIEHIDSLGLDILYVPDEWKHKAVDTVADIRELLKEHKLTKVDIAIMHGNFKYQLPIVSDSAYDEADMLDMVKYYISIGHIHVSSVYDRILAQGSFDRLRFGEEGSKGATYITIYANGDKEYMFIKNTKAVKYDTYKYDSDVDIEYLLNDLRGRLKTLKPFSHVRVVLNDKKSFTALLDPLKKRYKDIVIKIVNKDTDDKEVDILNMAETVVETFEITKSNIEELLLAAIVNKHDMNGLDLRVYHEEMKQII